jgi:hypothetical protein
MQKSFTRAGGCFFPIAMIGGFALGAVYGQPMKGILIGTAVGAALAIALWLFDRRA